MQATGVTNVHPLGRFPFAAMTVDTAQLPGPGQQRPDRGGRRRTGSRARADGERAARRAVREPRRPGRPVPAGAVAILDTGVESSHPFLGRPGRGRGVLLGRRRIEGRHDASAPTGNTQQVGPGAARPCASGCEHGTHVAGIAAGRNDTDDGRGAEQRASSPSRCSRTSAAAMSGPNSATSARPGPSARFRGQRL